MSATKASGAFHCLLERANECGEHIQHLQKDQLRSKLTIQDQSDQIHKIKQNFYQTYGSTEILSQLEDQHVEPWTDESIGNENNNNFSQVHPYYEQIIFPDLVRKISFARKQSKYVPSTIIVGKKVEKLMNNRFWELRPMPTHNIPRPKEEQNFAFIYSEMEKLKITKPKVQAMNSNLSGTEFTTEVESQNYSFMNSNSKFEKIIFPALVRKVGFAMKHNKRSDSIVDQKMKTFRKVKTFLDLRFWENNEFKLRL